MGRKAFKERLKEIEMSQYDARLYDDYSCSIQKQVNFIQYVERKCRRFSNPIDREEHVFTFSLIISVIAYLDFFFRGPLLDISLFYEI